MRLPARLHLGKGRSKEEREGLCPRPNGRPGAPPRSAPPPPTLAEGGLSSCLPAGGGGRRVAVVPRGREALACPGPRLLGARERRLFPGPRLLRGRGRPRRFLRPPPRPPSPRRRAAAGRAGHLPCGAGCRPAQAAWPGCALPPRRLRPGRPVPRRSPPTPGKRPHGEGEREMAAPAPSAAPPACGGSRAAGPGAQPRARPPRRRGLAACPLLPGRTPGRRLGSVSLWILCKPQRARDKNQIAFHVYFKQTKIAFNV